ncbi:hypothetical protein EVAR_101432_1 [Eumeta japonica]|uniref:Uncharacterized protein n=1 Tax=Eumeta variegata TaxID=151549 RepID=A0A4C1TRW2_EUMVA|nr:hypothetical protein EVAR_101432_1 [Eumeta japonica]
MDAIKSSPSLDSNLSTPSSLITKHVVSTRSSTHTTHDRVNIQKPKTNSNQLSSSANTTATSSSKIPNVTTKKTEESSDSDEPLIEVAGKVRSSKAAAAGSPRPYNYPYTNNKH